MVDLRQSLKTLENENQDLKLELQRLQSDNQMKRNILSKKPEPSKVLQTFYGFTAFATAERGYSSGDRVTFDGLRANYGNAYDSASNSFTCPVTGHYYFDLNLFLSNRREFGASITVGSSSVTKVYIRADANDDVRGSTSAVVQCSAGTQVMVICRDSGNLEGNQDAETTFSGFLISVD